MEVPLLLTIQIGNRSEVDEMGPLLDKVPQRPHLNSYRSLREHATMVRSGCGIIFSWSRTAQMWRMTPPSISTEFPFTPSFAAAKRTVMAHSSTVVKRPIREGASFPLMK